MAERAFLQGWKPLRVACDNQFGQTAAGSKVLDRETVRTTVTPVRFESRKHTHNVPPAYPVPRAPLQMPNGFTITVVGRTITTRYEPTHPLLGQSAKRHTREHEESPGMTRVWSR